MANQGRVKDLQNEASQFGNTLLRLGHYNIDSLKPGLAEQVRAIGRELHLVETMRLVLDGGRSVNAIVKRIIDSAGELTDLANSFDAKPSPGVE